MAALICAGCCSHAAAPVPADDKGPAAPAARAVAAEEAEGQLFPAADYDVIDWDSAETKHVERLGAAAEGRNVLCEMRSARGIFSLRVKPFGGEVESVTLRMRGLRTLEAAGFSAGAGRRETKLHPAETPEIKEGVVVNRDGEDVELTITGAALEAMRGGGVIVIIDAWRG